MSSHVRRRLSSAPAALPVLALPPLALLAGCSRAQSGGTPKGRPAPSVVVTKVVARDVPIEVVAPVDLRPLEQADVGSKVLGYIDAIFVAVSYTHLRAHETR